MKTQKCKKCGKTKPIEQFGFNLKKGDKYLKSQCKSCEAAYRREWVKKSNHKEIISDPTTLRNARETYWKNFSSKDLIEHIEKYNNRIELLADKQEKYQQIIDFIEEILETRKNFQGL